MPKTQNLGLTLTDDNTTTVKDWRISINGVGTDGELSNMQLIDTFAGGISKSVKDLNELIGTLNTALQNRLDGAL